MGEEAQKIGKQIKELLDQLVAMAISKPIDKKGLKRTGIATATKGASGALSLLINEGFFDLPKDLNLIMEKMKEIGRYYPKTTVSMNLLNLTKRRTFNRIKDKKTRKWQYVLRK
jgi:hypothetical protein